MRKSFYCIDAHTCGNPVRLIASGGPNLEGENMMDKRLHFIEEYDWIRKGLMFEPRGHDMMSGIILYPACDPENDIGLIFIETSGCLPMCGHGTIGAVTIMLEEGLVQPKVEGKLRLETPGGTVLVSYQRKGNKIKTVKLTNIPSFLFKKGVEIECSELGQLIIDVAFGGNFYGIIDLQRNFKGIQEYSADQLITWSRSIRKQLNAQDDFQHPTSSDINGLSHILWVGNTISKESDARNAVFYGDKAIDRSPCGTGTSARMAQLFSKGELHIGDSFIHESYIGSKFIGCIESVTQVGDFEAIVPSIEGWARITGHNNIVIDDEDDPYAFGFQVL